MNSNLYNLPDIPAEDQEVILKEQIKNIVKEISNFFQQDKIEALARETEFVERESKLTGLLFLATFVFGAVQYGNPTLEQLIGLLNLHIQDFSLSRPGLHKRINDEAVIFFEQVLSLAVEQHIPNILKINLPPQFNRILLWDSTSFQLPKALSAVFSGLGGSASIAGAKIQFCYDLVHHQWQYILQSATHSDSTIVDEIISNTQAGDLIIQDLGYFNVNIFDSIHEKDAYYLSRFKRDANIYFMDATGNMQGFDLVTVLRHEQVEKQLELDVYIRSKHNIFTPTRLIVERLPEQVVNQRLRKSNKEARSRGYQISNQTIFLADFNFYITNAPRNLLDISCCHFLYAIRWQIELVFKVWKSCLKFHKFQVKHRSQRVKITIFARLIYITLTAKIIGVTRDIFWFTSNREISYDRAMKYLLGLAQYWFSLVLCDACKEIFILLQRATFFIRNCFKIPQHDRLYPLEKLQLFGELIFTS